MTEFIKKKEVKKNWYKIDATNLIVGRLASEITKILRGKKKTSFTPNMDDGDFVIVTNASKIKFTGKKFSKKIYYKHTGFPGGIKETTPNKILEKNKIIQDSLSSIPLLIVLENDSSSFHTYNRNVNNITLVFQKNNDTLIDTYSQSIWNYDGICIEGKLKGASLTPIASYQEYLHSWEYFHPNSIRSYLK